jgi:hypothetical protein
LTGQKRKIPDPKDEKIPKMNFLSICSASIWEVGKLIGIELLAAKVVVCWVGASNFSSVEMSLSKMNFKASAVPYSGKQNSLLEEKFKLPWYVAGGNLANETMFVPQT